MIGVVGFDLSFRPAIALTNIPRPQPEEEEEEDPDPCAPFYGHDLDLTLTGIVNGPSCLDLGTSSVLWTSISGVNASHTLDYASESWSLLAEGTIGYSIWSASTTCFGSPDATGTVAVNYSAFCIDGVFTVYAQTAEFTAAGVTVPPQAVFVGNGELDAVLTNNVSTNDQPGLGGSGVLTLL